jgi:hypothetical protein
MDKEDIALSRQTDLLSKRGNAPAEIHRGEWCSDRSDGAYLITNF